MVFNIELRAVFCDHSIVKIGTIIRDDPFRYVVPLDNVILNEYGHKILGN